MRITFPYSGSFGLALAASTAAERHFWKHTRIQCHITSSWTRALQRHNLQFKQVYFTQSASELIQASVTAASVTAASKQASMRNSFAPQTAACRKTAKLWLTRPMLLIIFHDLQLEGQLSLLAIKTSKPDGKDLNQAQQQGSTKHDGKVLNQARRQINKMGIHFNKVGHRNSKGGHRNNKVGV